MNIQRKLGFHQWLEQQDTLQQLLLICFLDGVFNKKGVFPPELIGKHEECFNYFMRYLRDRNINYRKRSNL